MKLQLENLPASLQPQRETLARCLEAMHAALPLREVILFGSHARGEARPDSDVDLCLVADGAVRQLAAASRWRGALRAVDGKPSFTLIPITPQRLGESGSWATSFSTRFSRKECRLPRKTDSNNPAVWLYIVACDLKALLALADQELGYSLCRGTGAEVLEKRTSRPN